MENKEIELQEKLKRIKKLEEEIQKREKALKKKEAEKKQILLRLSPELWTKIAKWSEEDFRSINSQIEYILAMAVKERFK